MKTIPRETYKKNKSHTIKWNPPGPESYIHNGKDPVFVDRKTRREYMRETKKIKARYAKIQANKSDED